MKTIKHKDKECIYIPEEHKYIVNGKDLKSVTKLISEITPEFKLPYHIMLKCMKKEGCKTFKELHAKWKAKGNKSMDEGTQVHKWLELKLQEQPTNDSILELYPILPKLVNVIKNKYHDFLFESIVFSEQFGLAGTIDLICRDSDSLVLLDWKTGKFEYSSKYAKLLKPFNKFDNCHINKYSIQLKLYKKILIEEGYYNEEIRTEIVHIQPNEFKFIPTISVKGFDEWITTLKDNTIL